MFFPFMSCTQDPKAFPNQTSCAASQIPHFCWIESILESMTQTSGLQGAHLSSFSGWPRVEQGTSWANLLNVRKALHDHATSSFASGAGSYCGHHYTRPYLHTVLNPGLLQSDCLSPLYALGFRADEEVHCSESKNQMRQFPSPFEQDALHKISQQI